jgi:hypothetical protein
LEKLGGEAGGRRGNKFAEGGRVGKVGGKQGEKGNEFIERGRGLRI